MSLSIPAATLAADHLPVTQSQLREFAALQEERHREHDDRHLEHDANHGQLQRAIDGKKDKRRGKLARSPRSTVRVARALGASLLSVSFVEELLQIYQGR